MKKTLFVLIALGLVVASLAGGSAFLLRQKHLSDMGRLASQAEDKLAGKSYEQAISMLRKVEGEGGTDRSSYLLGKAYTEQRKFEEAERYFQKLLKEYPKSPLVPEARLALARYHIRETKDLDKAQEHLLHILAHPKAAAADHALVGLAEISLAKKDESQARKNLEIVLRKKNSPAKSEAEFLIGDLNMKRLKSPDAAPGDELYTIQRGDTLWAMERRLKIPMDLLVGINDLDPNALTVGTQIRVPRLDISLIIDKPARTVSIMNGAEFLKKYRVGINQNDSALPAGRGYKVIKKYDKGLEWVNPQTNEAVKAGDPENPYGNRFIELRRDVGLHGTNDEEKVGQLISVGTVMMSNQDVNELYALVQLNTPVTVRGSVNPENSPGR